MHRVNYLGLWLLLVASGCRTTSTSSLQSEGTGALEILCDSTDGLQPPAIHTMVMNFEKGERAGVPTFKASGLNRLIDSTQLPEFVASGSLVQVTTVTSNGREFLRAQLNPGRIDLSNGFSVDIDYVVINVSDGYLAFRERGRLAPPRYRANNCQISDAALKALRTVATPGEDIPLFQ